MSTQVTESSTEPIAEPSTEPETGGLGIPANLSTIQSSIKDHGGIGAV